MRRKAADQGEHSFAQHAPDAERGTRVPRLAGVRKAAKEHQEIKFTALLHHLTVGLLRESFYALKRKPHRE